MRACLRPNDSRFAANRADDNPNIHSEKNGSAEGWLANVKGMVGLNGTVYVPGHGDLQMKADIERRLAAVTARRAKVAAMIKDGKSLEDIKAALPDASAPGARPGGAPAGAPPGGGQGAGGRGAPAAAAPARGPVPGFVDIVYAELTKKKAA